MIWIIERQVKRGAWEPTAAAGLTQKDAKREMDYHWKHNHPDGKFRVKRYAADSSSDAKIWVVEQRVKRGVWESTVGAEINRKEAIREKEYYWEHNFPEEMFRVKRYANIL